MSRSVESSSCLPVLLKNYNELYTTSIIVDKSVTRYDCNSIYFKVKLRIILHFTYPVQEVTAQIFFCDIGVFLQLFYTDRRYRSENICDVFLASVSGLRLLLFPANIFLV